MTDTETPHPDVLRPGRLPEEQVRRKAAEARVEELEKTAARLRREAADALRRDCDRIAELQTVLDAEHRTVAEKDARILSLKADIDRLEADIADRVGCMEDAVRDTTIRFEIELGESEAQVKRLAEQLAEAEREREQLRDALRVELRLADLRCERCGCTGADCDCPAPRAPAEEQSGAPHDMPGRRFLGWKDLGNGYAEPQWDPPLPTCVDGSRALPHPKALTTLEQLRERGWEVVLGEWLHEQHAAAAPRRDEPRDRSSLPEHWTPTTDGVGGEGGCSIEVDSAYVRFGMPGIGITFPLAAVRYALNMPAGPSSSPPEPRGPSEFVLDMLVAAGKCSPEDIEKALAILQMCSAGPSSSGDAGSAAELERATKLQERAEREGDHLRREVTALRTALERMLATHRREAGACDTNVAGLRGGECAVLRARNEAAAAVHREVVRVAIEALGRTPEPAKPEPGPTVFERLRARLDDDPLAADRIHAAIDDICECGGSVKHNEHAEGCDAGPESGGAG